MKTGNENEKIKEIKSTKSIRLTAAMQEYLDEMIDMYKNESDSKNDQQELALKRILNIADAEHVKGVHPELAPALKEIEKTMEILAKQINGIVGGQDAIVTDLRNQLDVAIQSKNKMRDEVARQTDEAKAKLLEADRMKETSTEKVNKLMKEAGNAREQAATAKKLVEEKDQTIHFLKEKVSMLETKVAEYTKLAENEQNCREQIKQLEQALVENDKNHEIELLKIKAEMTQKLSESEKDAKLAVAQALGDKERELRSLYEDKIRVVDKENIRLQLLVEQLESR